MQIGGDTAGVHKGRDPGKGVAWGKRKGEDPYKRNSGLMTATAREGVWKQSAKRKNGRMGIEAGRGGFDKKQWFGKGGGFF